MGDLVSHYVIARLPSSWADRRSQALFLAGTLLPDLIAKFLAKAVDAADGWEANAHALPGFALYAYLASLFFDRAFRPRAWLALTLGGYLHILVDLLKDNRGAGSSFLGFPFSRQAVEFGLYDPEEWIVILPISALILIVWEVLTLRKCPDHYVWK